MKTILLATVTIVGLASAGVANAEQAQVKLLQLAAIVQPLPQAGAAGTNLAANGLPAQDTSRLGTQLAASGKPNLDTIQRGTQLAAAGGSHPNADPNVHGTQST